MAKVRHDARWLTKAEKKDIGILENAQPMKCSNVLKLADDEEGLFNYLCNFCCGFPLLFIYLFWSLTYPWRSRQNGSVDDRADQGLQS